MKLSVFSFACAMAITTASAQDDAFMPKPSPALDAFEPMIGNWAGKGTFIQDAGGAETAWTGIYTAKRILGGFAVQEDMRVEMPMGALVMRTLYGFDGERNMLVCHTLSNMGASSPTVRWLDANRLHAVSSGIDPMGRPYMNRWTHTFKGDSSAFVMECAIGDGPVFTHVTGEWKRADQPFSAEGSKAAPMMMTGKAEMQRLGAMRGAYDFAGQVVMDQGQEPFPVTGTETVDWLFEGVVLANHVKGQPGDFEAFGYMTWDPLAGCYKHIGVNTMGTIGTTEVRLADGKLVFTSADPWMGTPGVGRSVLELSKDGKPTSVVEYRMAGAGPAYEAFTGTYTPAAAGDKTSSAALNFTPGSCCARAQAAGSSCTHPCCATAISNGEVCKACNK